MSVPPRKPRRIVRLRDALGVCARVAMWFVAVLAPVAIAIGAERIVFVDWHHAIVPWWISGPVAEVLLLWCGPALALALFRVPTSWTRIERRVAHCAGLAFLLFPVWYAAYAVVTIARSVA